MKAADLQLIQTFAEGMDGVFTLPDLRVLFAGQGEPALYKKLEAAVREGFLTKVKRGLYATPSASLDVVSSRIAPESYLTTGTVLSRAMLIGSVPGRRVQAAKVGPPRRYQCKLGTIEHLSLKPELFFGYEAGDGVKIARPEKAFLDACYFFFKGRRFSFDLDEDVDIAALNKKRLAEYLSAYDRRFISFFENRWRVSWRV